MRDDPRIRLRSAAIVRRNRLPLALAAAFTVLAPAAFFVLSKVLGPTQLGGAAALSFFAGIIAMAFAADRAGDRELRGEIEAGEQGLSFRGRRLLAREDIQSGVIVPRAGACPLVRLRKRRGKVDVAVADANEGRELLRALGQDASQTIVTFGAVSPLVADGTSLVVTCVAAALFSAVGGIGMDAITHSHSGGLFVPVFRVGIFVTAMLLGRAKLTVGADGVLTSWYGRQRFFPYEDIEGVETYQTQRDFSRSKVQGVRLWLRSGSNVDIPVILAGTISRPDVERIDAIVERIREATEQRGKSDKVGAAALLRRGNRDMTSWLTLLRSIGAGAHSDLRTAPVPTDTLWRILEDSKASAAERAGAAGAVRAASTDEASRARIAAAAHATASPKVRIALEAAYADDDDALAEALASLEEAEKQRAAV